MAFALPTVVFLLQKDIGLSLHDEGFVWYGAQRVLADEVPLRDFQAYDIARYYWYAAWMWASDSLGIIPLRAGSAALAGCSVAIAVTLVRSARRQSVVVTSLAVATFALWMVPYYKVADSFAAALLVGGLARLVDTFALRRWLTYGICVGIAASIGINHALYGAVAGALAVAWALWQRPGAVTLRRAAGALAGFLVGYSPVIAFHVAVPGFAAAFADSVLILFELGTTNLDRPLWDLATAWLADGPVRPAAAFRQLVLGATFLIATPAFIALCIWRLLRNTGPGPSHASPVFVAAVLTSIPYAHYAYSRPDIAHFSVGVLPLLVAAWSFPSRRAVGNGGVRQMLLLAVFVITGVLAGSEHALFQALKGAPLLPVKVAGETLRVSPSAADELRFFQQVTQTHAAGGRSIYVVPYSPGAYAVTGLRSPVWEIYAIFPATEERQRREIARLWKADVAVAVVSQEQMDGRADLGFNQTHPIIARHLAQCMTPLADQQLAAAAPDVVVYVARPQACATQ
ncbi:MAG: hypothetical protein H7Z19_08485 [Chitinophagaceae bacterium]|nr:hypothetical protein [Rubrivivax sp.]